MIKSKLYSSCSRTFDIEKPIGMMTDFERLLQFDEFANIFTGVLMGGCFFHFAQCLRQKIRNLPEIRYKCIDDADLDLKIKQLMALIFCSCPIRSREIRQMNVSTIFLLNT